MNTIKILLISLSVSSLQIAITCWILRLECKSEGEFDVKIDNHRLEGRVISTHTTSQLGCVELCEQAKNCTSLNYKKYGTKNCELNSNIKELESSLQLKRIDGWVYFATNYTNKNIGSYCNTFSPCNADEYCLDTCACPAYNCLPLNKLPKFGDANLALHKEAYLSSQFDRGTKPENAVDDRKASSHSDCAITKQEQAGQQPFFRVDLGKTFMIGSVALQNRHKVEYSMRLNPFDVMVGDSLENGGRNNPKCVEQGRFQKANQFLQVDCSNIMFGRYVVITTQHTDRILELCEFEVYGWQ